MRVLWAAIGSVGLALALIGTLLPLMPTVPFLLLAAYGFARSSPRTYAWMLNHPRLGPPLRAWQDHGAISTRSKQIAVLGMIGSIVLGWLMLSPLLWLIQIVVICLAGLFVVTRPTPPDEQPPA